MTLFLTKEYWSFDGENDECDVGCMAIANLDNSESGKLKIAIGCFNGLLRIFSPTSRGYKSEDLLLEKDLGSPIIQIMSGKFISGSSHIVLAVLHPKELSVYKFLRKNEGESDISTSYDLILAYKRALGYEESHFTAFNMCSGYFGQQKLYEHICVQGMDGQLLFYEQSKLAAHTKLPKVYLPGPILYISQIDSIIHGASDMYVTCYKYKSLMQFENTGNKELNISEWSCNLGDHPISIHCGKFNNELIDDQFDIIILAEHSVFFLRDLGNIRSNMRLSFIPVSLSLFRNVNNTHDSMLISTLDHKIYVYYQNQVIWNVSIGTSMYVQINVGEFFGVNGFLCGLEDNGRATLFYMGTKVANVSNMLPKSKPMNPETIEKEYVKLLNIIKTKDINSKQSTNTDDDKMRIKVMVPSSVNSEIPNEISDGPNYAKDVANNILCSTINIFITYEGQPINNVNVAISCSDSFIPCPSSITLPYISGSSTTPILKRFHFVTHSKYIPTTLEGYVSVSFINSNNELKAIYERFNVPLFQSVMLVPPVTKSTYKFDVITTNNSDAVPLVYLFQDMTKQPYFTEQLLQPILGPSQNVMTFQYFNNEKCTIIVSKNGGKYRIQSTTFSTLWVVTREFLRRFNMYQRSKDKDPIKLSYQEVLPLGDYFNVIDEHLNIRKTLNKLYNKLNDLSFQYRSIQKRLLIRYKQKNPTELNNMDLLLFNTINSINELAESIKQSQFNLKIATQKLMASTSLIISLISWTYSLSNDSVEVLKYHLSPVIDSTSDGKWEEETSASLIFLLRTALSSQAKDNVVVNQNMDMPENNDQLKHCIKLLCDKLSSGFKLSHNS